MPLSFGSSGHIPVTVSTSTTANPATGTFTCGANDEALVLIIFYASNVQRTGGSPTFGTGTFVQAQSLAGVTEAVCEIWYMENPPNDATYLVSIPNANTRTLWANLVSITAPATFGAEYHVSGINETTASNPNVSVTPTVTGTFAVAGVATGDNTFDPTAQSGVEVYNDDPAAYGSASQYYSIGPSGTVAISWTEATSDDYGALAVVFRERAKPITINLDPALLNLEGKQATPTVPVEPVIVNLQPAILSLSAKSATVDAPFPPTQVNLQPAQLSLSAQSSSIEKGEVTINLQPARLTLSAPQSDVIPGDVTVNLDTAILRLNDGWWWLAGSIQPSECIVVYQPKGASSYANSKINIINPGTYDAVEGFAPSWSSAIGWTFNGTSTWLDTNLVGGNNYSAVVKVTGSIAQTKAVFGETTQAGNSTRFNIYTNYLTDGKSYFRSGGTFSQSVTYNYGTLAVTPDKGYYNGNPVGQLSSRWTGTTTSTIVVGGHKINNVVSETWSGSLEAIAIYNITLPDEQVLAVSSALDNLQSTRITIDAPPPGIQINLQPAMLSLSAKQASLQKGAVTVTLDPALLTLSGKNVTISAPLPGIQIDLQPARLSLSAKSSTVQKGGVSIALDPALLSLNGKTATISTGGAPQTINLQPARLTLSGKSASIQKGAVSISLDPALLNLSGNNATIITPYSQTINLDPALLTISGQIAHPDNGYTPPSPAPCIPTGGGGLLKRQDTILILLPKEDRKKRLDEDIVIITE